VSDSARSVLGEHFVLFKPKNIVSGDFYWTTKINNLLFVAVADCTGHGVPGAFMSMLGISFLNEIVQKQEINKASQILNQLRTEIINALQQKGISGEQKDGLDISLLVLNTETNEAQWAGANNPLYIIKTPVSLSQRPELIEGIVEDKGAGHTSTPLSVTDNFIELKGDKMPIAIYPVMNDFTNHEFVLQKGDSVFLFTDGYADQFGGSKGRKFMYKKFKEILLENVDKPMLSQRLILENTLEEWKGIFEQIDDITILSMRILK
ncbi:MAG: SpoIIE family protein phosphatase, partial [Bacteroidia bacterium]|nr:SpoIIE family protein phosphatase [Bacteroidia bacterium]